MVLCNVLSELLQKCIFLTSGWGHLALYRFSIINSFWHKESELSSIQPHNVIHKLTNFISELLFVGTW